MSEVDGMGNIRHDERTCDRCARSTTDWATIDEAYICADCRAEIAAEEAEVEALRDQLRGAVYPRDDGDVTVIGPECFATKDGSVLNWRGVNYVPQPDPPRGQ